MINQVLCPNCASTNISYLEEVSGDLMYEVFGELDGKILVSLWEDHSDVHSTGEDKLYCYDCATEWKPVQAFDKIEPAEVEVLEEEQPFIEDLPQKDLDAGQHQKPL